MFYDTSLVGVINILLFLSQVGAETTFKHCNEIYATYAQVWSNSGDASAALQIIKSQPSSGTGTLTDEQARTQVWPLTAGCGQNNRNYNLRDDTKQIHSDIS